MILLLKIILMLGIPNESETINPCKLEERTLLHCVKDLINLIGFSKTFKMIN